MTQTMAITGAAGFLGNHLVRAFRAMGIRVIPIVRRIDERAPAESIEMAKVLERPGCLEGCDVLIHAAAIRHRHGIRIAEYRESNVGLVERLVGAAKGCVRRFVYVSSVGVYGFPKNLPIRETHPYAPATLYSATKIDAERFLRDRASKEGLEYTIARPTIIYGPGDTNGMLDKMARMIRSGSYRIVGSGANTLHHTHIDDMVHGIHLAATHPRAKDEDFILSGPETVTLGELSLLVANAVERPLARMHVPLWFARGVASAVDFATYRKWAFVENEPPINHEKLDVMTRSIAFDSTKAKEMIGFSPRVRYREGVRRTLAGEAA